MSYLILVRLFIPMLHPFNYNPLILSSPLLSRSCMFLPQGSSKFRVRIRQSASHRPSPDQCFTRPRLIVYFISGTFFKNRCSRQTGYSFFDKRVLNYSISEVDEGSNGENFAHYTIGLWHKAPRSVECAGSLNDSLTLYVTRPPTPARLLQKHNRVTRIRV